jgi:N,N-dimethylformamidase
MLEVDPTDMAPCEEYFENPVGPHSPDLQRLLIIMRADTVDDPNVIVEANGGGFGLGMVSDVRGVPVRVYEGVHFDTYADALRAMFKLRWEMLTGRALPLGKAIALDGFPLHEVVDERILAYADRWDVRPGETVSFKVSTGQLASDYRFDVARIRSAVGHPDGPGQHLVSVPSEADGQYKGRNQVTSVGSYIAFSRRCPVELSGFSVRVNVKPTLETGRPQSLLGTWDAARDAGFALYLDEATRLSLIIGDGRGEPVVVSTTKPLPLGYWHEATGSYDPESGKLRVTHRCLQWGHLLLREGRAERQLDSRPVLAPQDFFIGAWKAADSSMTAHFNGKMEAPTLFSSALFDEHAFVAGWDFSTETSGTGIIDTSANSWNGHAVNLPTRAMKGSQWDGTAHRWTDNPAHYAAIHFHEDDVVDCGWADDVVLTIPSDWKSGVYCARFHQHEQTAYASFFVLPAKGKPSSDLAVLMPTATYVCYGNDGTHVQRRRFLERSMNRFATLSRNQMYLQMHPELGASTYDMHRDGSGVCFASRHRPFLDMAPTNSVWNFGADTLILDWLEECGHSYDILTDEAIDREGIELLGQYRCVISGSHPEYTSPAMSDAILAYLEQGGRFMYLGANGFYWKIAYQPDDTGLIEIRRAEDGGRNWIAEPGEYYLAATGELSGLWRRNGRTPQALLGVGYTACGFDSASYYDRTQESFDPRATWIFDGVGENEKIGDFGFSLGGAAGAELDRADVALGTPAHALTVASATHLSAGYLTVPEEFYHLTSDINGENSPLVRADMVFFETPAGGAVFSTGSISWCDGLSHNHYDNNVARITGNVVECFLEPQSFKVPD